MTILKLSGVFLAFLLTSPSSQESLLTTEQEEEWRKMARASRLVVEGTVTDEYVRIVRPELRRPIIRRGPSGETLMQFKSPPDHVVGLLVRVRVDAILKPDGHAAIGDVVDVVMSGRDLPGHEYTNGARWLWFLETPFRLAGEDHESGWQTLEGTVVRETGTQREIPFVPARAYGLAVGVSMFSPIAYVSKRLTPESAALMDSVRQQVALTVDTVAPTVTLTQPSVPSGFQKGVGSLAAAASDNMGIRSVEWLIERQPSAPPPPGVAINAAVPITAPITGGPYLANWDSTQFADGHYTLWAAATDFAGNVGVASTTVIIDNTAPVFLERQATPSSMWPATGDLIPVKVKIGVIDGLDPAPVVRLVEVTANEPLAPGDVAQATFGTDDRNIELRASRTGPTRIYAVVYDATDQAGNTSQASATVTVSNGPLPPQE